MPHANGVGTPSPSFGGGTSQKTYLRVRSVFPGQPGDGWTAEAMNAVQLFIAPGNVRALLVSVESPLVTPPFYGYWYACDAITHEVIWEYRDASETYPLLAGQGDVHADGSNRLVVTFGNLPGHEVVCLRPDGTVDWQYIFPHIYARSAAVGKVRQDIAGNQVACSGSAGGVSLLDQYGNQIWTTTVGDGFTAQGVTVVDADNDGTDEIYVAQGFSVYRLNPADGSVIWETILDTTRPMGIASGHMFSGTNKQIIATGYINANDGMVYCLDHTGAILWTYTSPYACWWPCCRDIDSDGIDEVFVISGTKGWEGPSFMGQAAVMMLRGYDGVELTRCQLPTDSGFISTGDIDGDGHPEVLIGANDTNIYILDARKYGNEPVGIKWFLEVTDTVNLTLTPFDATIDLIAKTPVATAGGMYTAAIAPNYRYMYLVSYSTNSVYPVNLNNPLAPTVGTGVATGGSGAQGIAVAYNSPFALVGNYGSHQFTPYDLTNPAIPVAHTVVASVITDVQSIAIAHSDTFALAVSYAGGQLVAIDMTVPLAPVVHTPVTVGGTGLYSVAISPDDTWAVITCSTSNNVAIVDLTSPLAPTITRLVATGAPGPEGVAILPDGKTFLVACTTVPSQLVAFDSTTPSLPVAQTPVAVGVSGAYEVVCTPDGKTAYVSNIAPPGTIVVFDLTNPKTPVLIESVVTGGATAYAIVVGVQP